MVRNVCFHPNKVLRRRSKEIVDLRKIELGDFIRDGIDTMLQNSVGGLALVQIGIPLRIVVLNCIGGRIVTLINPKIIEHSGSVTSTETCLSLPGQEIRLHRYSQIKVEHERLSGIEVLDVKEPDLAVALQHEIDHLNGVLMLDRTN